MGHDLPHGSWFAQMNGLTGDILLMLRTRPTFTVEFDGRADRGLPLDAALGRWVDPEGGTLLHTVMAMQPGDTSRRDYGSDESIWVSAVLRCRADGDDTLVEGVLHDITPRKQAEKALADSERRHRLLAENAWDVVWTMALDGTITYVSPAVERVRGFTPEEARSQSLGDIHPPDSAVRVMRYYDALHEAMEAGNPLPEFHGEQEYYRKDGSIMHGELQVIPHVDDQGHVVELLGVTRDISERKRYEDELHRLAETDPLTGVINRRSGERLLAAKVREPAVDQPTCLILLDIDRFKAINDSMGHEACDRVLVAVIEEVTAATRRGDAIIRWGGDEFIVLLPGCAVEGGLSVGEAIRERVALLPERGLPEVTVSLGVTTLQPGDTAGSWLDRADTALYAAKTAGRDGVRAG